MSTRTAGAAFIQDVTLRDGMHALNHQFPLDKVQEIAKALDEAGVDAIEITHGDGLSGSSFNYGFSSHSDCEWISAIAEVVDGARVTTLLMPGIAVKDDIVAAHRAGARSVRIATLCTEANISRQHIETGRELDMDTVGFLMMCHIADARTLVDQARLMEGYGAQCIYITDSAGAMLPEEVAERVRAVRGELEPQTELGVHCHENLGVSIANSVAAFNEGANRIDASLAGHGAGAGNTPLEVLVAVLDRMELDHGCNLFRLMDAADDLVRPIQDRPVVVDRESLSLGYSGVYSSFLRHAERASSIYGVDAREIIVELGRRNVVGGQEDMIVDVALDIARSR